MSSVENDVNGAAAAPADNPEGEKKLSKNALKKMQKEKEKAAKKAAKQAAQQATQLQEEDIAQDKYGNMKMIQSTEKPDRKLVAVGSVGAAMANQDIWIRGRLHTSRGTGKQCFTVIRQ